MQYYFCPSEKDNSAASEREVEGRRISRKEDDLIPSEHLQPHWALHWQQKHPDGTVPE